MGSKEIVTLLFLVSMCLVWSSEAGGRFYVGEKDGWVVKPSESYDKWAKKSRFQIGDTLVFKYKKGQDSVLVVNETDFNSCNIQKPIKKLDDDGDSKFTIKNSGLIYFISGNQENCKNGEKLVIRVLSPRPPSPPKAPESPKPSPPPPKAPESPKPSPPQAPVSKPPAPSSPKPSPPPPKAPESPKPSPPQAPVSKPPAPSSPKPSPPQTPVSKPPAPSSPPSAHDHKTPPPPKSSAPAALTTSSMGFIVGFSLLASLLV